MAATILNLATLVQIDQRYLLGETSSPPHGAAAGDWYLAPAYDFDNGTVWCIVAVRWAGTQFDFGDSILMANGPYSWQWGNDGLSYVHQGWSGDTAEANNGGFTVYTATQSGAIHTEVVSVPDMPVAAPYPWHRNPILVAGVGNMVGVYDTHQLANINDFTVRTYRINDNGTVTAINTVTGPAGGDRPFEISNINSMGRVDPAPNVIVDIAAYTSVDSPDAYITRGVDLTDPLTPIICTSLVDADTGNYWARNGDNRGDHPHWKYPTPYLSPTGQGFAYWASDGIVTYTWTGSDFSYAGVQATQSGPQGDAGWVTYARPLSTSEKWLAVQYDPAGGRTNIYYDMVDPQWSALVSTDGTPASDEIGGLYADGFFFSYEPTPGPVLLPGDFGDYTSVDYYQLGYLPNLIITGQIESTRIRSLGRR